MKMEPITVNSIKLFLKNVDHTIEPFDLLEKIFNSEDRTLRGYAMYRINDFINLQRQNKCNSCHILLELNENIVGYQLIYRDNRTYIPIYFTDKMTIKPEYICPTKIITQLSENMKMSSNTKYDIDRSIKMFSHIMHTINIYYLIKNEHNQMALVMNDNAIMVTDEKNIFKQLGEDIIGFYLLIPSHSYSDVFWNE